MAEMLMQPVTGPSVWYGRDIAASTAWILRLEVGHIDELDRLLALAARDAAIERSTAAQFPRLEGLLREAERLLLDERGIALLRGFPVARYALADIEKLFLALGRLMGVPVSQNSYGDVLGHVRDEGKRFRTTGENTRGARGYLSNETLLFHADLGDIVGLLCLQDAIEGGLSSVSSSMTVYNEILASHPEYLPALYAGFPFRSVEAGGERVDFRIPTYSYHRGRLSCAIRRMAIETARLNGMPYTDLENAALEYFDATAARADLRFDMKLERGDIQLLNNYSTLHARTHFRDADEPERRRHLLRLWLQLPRGRAFLRVYPTIYDGIPKTLSR
jgi:hypothetical protein